MGAVEVTLAVMVAVGNLAIAAVLLVRSRGGAVPRLFGRPQPLPRLRAVMHVCLGLGLGVGWLVQDVFPAHSTGDTVLSSLTRFLLVAGMMTALLVALRHPRPVPDEATR